MPQTHATADFSYGCCEKYEAGVKIQTFKKGLRMSWKFTGIFGWKKIVETVHKMYKKGLAGTHYV